MFQLLTTTSLGVGFVLMAACSAADDTLKLVVDDLPVSEFVEGEHIALNIRAKNATEKILSFMSHGSFVAWSRIVITGDDSAHVRPVRPVEPFGRLVLAQSKVKSLAPSESIQTVFMISDYYKLQPGGYECIVEIDVPQNEFGVASGKSISNRIKFNIVKFNAAKKSDIKLSDGVVSLCQTKDGNVWAKWQDQDSIGMVDLVRIGSIGEFASIKWSGDNQNVYVIDKEGEGAMLFAIYRFQKSENPHRFQMKKAE